jgi:hypothetical protein
MKSLVLGVVVATALIAGSVPNYASDRGGTPTKGTTSPVMATTGYRFELTGPQRTDVGRSTVAIRLIHTIDNKPVIGATIIQSRADLGPIGLLTTTAPIKQLPSTTPGIYRFEIANGTVWNRLAKWALTFSAKIPGETQAVRGNVIVQLSP